MNKSLSSHAYQNACPNAKLSIMEQQTIVDTYGIVKALLKTVLVHPSDTLK